MVNASIFVRNYKLIGPTTFFIQAYMGTWAGLTGLYHRETRNKVGVSAGSSLALIATLMQFTHLGDGN